MVDGGCAVSATPTPCPSRPMAANVAVLDSGGSRRVASVETASDGTFRVVLPPGKYLLHATNVNNAPLPAAEDLPVTVEPSQFVMVKIVFDSGVR